MRRTAGRILPRERVAQCGQKALSGIVTLHRNDGHAHFGGIETCASVWMCPVCAAKITEGRRAEVDTVLQVHRQAGGTAFMATLTIPHHRFQSCHSLKQAVSTAWRKVKSGKPWVRAREAHAWLGDVRALEVTHGENGWHPHLHVLVFFRPGAPRRIMEGFGDWLFDAWAGAIYRLGFGTCSQDAFAWEPVNAESGAAEYVGKWGAALELTKAHTKRGRGGGRTPWEILRDASQGRNTTDQALFREYAKAFKGARQLTWSRDLRALYLVEAEPTDEQLAEEPQSEETQTAALARDLFKIVARRGLTAHVLEAEEAEGLSGVLAVLDRFSIPWEISECPGLKRNRWVPLVSLGTPGEPPPARNVLKGRDIPNNRNHGEDR